VNRKSYMHFKLAYTWVIKSMDDVLGHCVRFQSEFRVRKR